MDEPCITLSVRDSVGIIALNRVRARNAMRESDWALLAELIEESNGRDDVLAVVLTGAGNFFCAGFDIKPRAALPGGPLPKIHAAIRSLVSSRKPLVAAVEGGAIGAGWAMVLACDLVVAADNAFFAPPFVERGLVPDVGITWLLTNSIGFHRASELILLSGRVTAHEGKQFGIVNNVVAEGHALEAAEAVAIQLASLPARTARVARAMLRRSLVSSFESMLMGEWMDVGFNAEDEDTKETRRTYVESMGAKDSSPKTST